MADVARYRLLAATTLALAGWGPFTCSDSTVERANELLRAGDGEKALERLKELDADAPEVHLSRAIGHLLRDQPAEARTALDQAYRLVAEALADERAEDAAERARLLDLKKRIAFSRGQAAIALEDWKAAYEEFANVLRLDPDDDLARWNLELAWFKLHPPCPLRDDDHEPDDTRADAPPWDPQKAAGRLLCPADEDWYAVEAPRGAFLFVTLEGEIDTDEDDETRDVTLELYPPDDTEPALRTAKLEGGKATVGVSGLPEGGAWKARVAGPGRAELKYGLKVEVVPPCPADDGLEENDEAAAASAVADGEQAGLKACPGDPDWFRVTVPAGQGRDILVRHDPARGPLAATLFDEAGEAPIAVAGRGAEGVAVKVPKADGEQVVLLHVEPAEAQENTYTLVVRESQDDENQDKNDEQQDDQDQKEDQQQDQDQQQNQDPQQNQDQQQKPQEEQQQAQPKPDQVDIDRLVDALDRHERNPQLEKLLRTLPAYPQMEDY